MIHYKKMSSLSYYDVVTAKNLVVYSNFVKFHLQVNSEDLFIVTGVGL
jgi:hypothetical protein